MIFDIPRVDVVISFGGGLYPETELPNHLSIARLMQLESYIMEIPSKPYIIVTGGAINYQTEVYGSKPSSERYKDFLAGGHIVPEDNIISTKVGFCTLTEALGARAIIEARKFNRIMYNSSDEHESRIRVILEHVLGKQYEYVANPYSQPDGHFMNKERETYLTDLFLKHFAQYLIGEIPYVDDKSFFLEHAQYYQESVSIIEKTKQGKEGFDDMAYLRREKE